MILEPKLKRYQKDFDFSYTFGIFPTMELLREREDLVIKVLFKREAEKFEDAKKVMQICVEKGINWEYADRAIGKIAYKENTFVVGVFRKYENKIERGKDHILLIEPRNAGNLGTIIRTMVGLGFNNLVLVGPSVDVFSPKVISSTMGAMFKVSIYNYNNLEGYIKENSDNNLYLFTLDGGREIGDIEFKSPATLLFGNESKGISEGDGKMGEKVYIPHSNDIESLNLSIACGIGMWEYRRKLN
jgi:TrmH family RNA methyltransferase